MIGTLEARYSAKVKDVIVNLSSSEKYETLKRELIDRLFTIQEHHTRKLLEREETGDRKPSQFLRRQLDQCSNAVTEPLLRTL